MRLLTLTILFLIFLPGVLPAQDNIGVPPVINFSHRITGAGAQNWAITQDRFGILYFANNSGLLAYNGKEWKLFPLPNKTIVRSLAISQDDRIYVGGQDAFGYFFPDERGVLKYHSLLDSIPGQYRSFGDVWNIDFHDNRIYFRSSRMIFSLNMKGGNVIVYPLDNFQWSFMGRVDNSLYAQNGRDNLVVFKDRQWKIVDSAITLNTVITGVLPFPGEAVLISTLRSGLFLLDEGMVRPFPVQAPVQRDQVYSAYRINDSTYALGTVSNGVYFIDNQGRTLRHFSTANGMQINNVLSLFVDNSSNMWAGLDEGVDLIDFNSPVQLISPLPRNPVPSYVARVYNNQLYIGTSDGLYATQLSLTPQEDLSTSRGIFQRFEGTEGQVWSLRENAGKLLMGHHEGAYTISNNQARLLSREARGVWLYRSIPNSGNNIAGTYTGIRLVSEGEESIVDNSFGDSLRESLRFVEVDYPRQVIWASHPYRGIYRMTMNRNFSEIRGVRFFTQEDGLPGNINNFVFKVRDSILFATEDGIYTYDSTSGVFKPAPRYQALLGKMPVKFMADDSSGRIWFATESTMGVIENDQVKYFPEMEGLLIAGFENIYPLNDRNIFIGSYKGILHLNYENYQQRGKALFTRLNKVVTINQKDSLLFDGYYVRGNQLLNDQNENSVSQLPPGFHSFHFEFSSNQYSQRGNISFSYRLIGFDEDWSPWSPKTEKDYTNLPYGEYTFEVRSRDNLGNISSPAIYSFQILPYWYQTIYAKIAYGILFILLLLLLNRMHKLRLDKQRRKFEQEEALIKYLHDLELENNEKEIVKLKNERLETEVVYKNKELASMTMHLYKRGRLLGKLKEELSTAVKNLGAKEDKADFNKLLKMVAEEEKRGEDWEQFALHFDQVHNQFLQKIKTAYPELTSTDLKICAYLKMNLSSKEMAQLLSITLKGVEIARYRLRKKLNLSPAESLTDFINTI